MNNQIFRVEVYVIVILMTCIQFSTSRSLNNEKNQYDENQLDSDDLLTNPGLLGELTKSQLEDLLKDIEKEENVTKEMFIGDSNHSNPMFLFDDELLQDLFSDSSSKEDLQLLSDMLIKVPGLSETEYKGNSSGETEGMNSQTQTQSQNVNIVANIYNKGAGGHHHHKHYHLLLLSDDGQAQGKKDTLKQYTLCASFIITITSQ